MSKLNDLAGSRFGIINVLSPTNKRKKGYIVWKCRCDCNNIVYLTTDELKRYKSCGCLMQKARAEIHNKLDFFEGTCIQWLEKRKYRCDNKSGFRGVFIKNNGKFKASIGFKGKRIYLGTFDTYEEAVRARLAAETDIYKPFLNEFYSSKISDVVMYNEDIIASQ